MSSLNLSSLTIFNFIEFLMASGALTFKASVLPLPKNMGAVYSTNSSNRLLTINVFKVF